MTFPSTRTGMLLCALAACGGGDDSRFSYSEPDGGDLRLVKKSASEDSITLDFVVGSTAKNGYSTGLTLPVDASLVTLSEFKPGTALDPGSAPAAAAGQLVEAGPLAGSLVLAVSQKAAGEGAVDGNASLAPGTVLFSITLKVKEGATEGVVFDGTASEFLLPSGGLRDRVGLMTVPVTGVEVGRLELKK